MAVTVKAGDSLSAIAKRELGDASRWREIYNLNKDQIKDPNLIFPGQTFKMPADAGIPANGGQRSALALRDGAAPVAAAGDGAAPVAAAGDGANAARGKAPYINQYRPAGAANGYVNGDANCGPTSMAMIARAFGKGGNMSDAQLINYLGGKGGTTANGTNVNGISAMAQAIGLGAETRGGADTAWIAEQLKAGKMVVANGDYYAMAPHANPAKVGTGGHYVSVVGMDANGNFIVNDPADKNVGTVSPEALARFIRGNRNGGYQIAVG
jgi:LysM repeat protein